MTPRISSLLLLSLLGAIAVGCKNECPAPTLDIAVCDPANGPFSLTIDNSYFPLPVGQQTVLESPDLSIRVQITVFDQTEVVAGVTTRIVEEREWEDGELVEVSRNFFAQAPDGTVCYFGEDVDDYQNGEIVAHHGAWRAGDGENLPGIMMPATPASGMVYFQEWAPGIAKDMAEVTATGVLLTTPAGTYASSVEMIDCNPRTGGKDAKVYAPDVGLALDEDAVLISIL